MWFFLLKLINNDDENSHDADAAGVGDGGSDDDDTDDDDEVQVTIGSIKTWTGSEWVLFIYSSCAHVGLWVCVFMFMGVFVWVCVCVCAQDLFYGLIITTTALVLVTLFQRGIGEYKLT